ncbi:hypothetical protein G7Z17_g2772 [Cylindrodendrum hubeiense]|uniref:Heterokaryon incompatibility domain-containing protein n=1 Tax=Cylindrodendrum hubeiense TaxID=595255 RepID=A0A9P5LBB6_9HYPO|nr:hypothetical protein G7Z17_g2772 [Cylindrodendrum hubeiense]
MLQNVFGRLRIQGLTQVPAALDLSEFSYLPLLPALKEIRLLKITSSNSGELCNIPLESAPSYSAISYAWGDPKHTAPYSINGEWYHIQQSLSDALSRTFSFLNRQNSYKALYVWADAICINQIDNVEKAAQVYLMGDIYATASQVVVYLGEESRSSSVAVMSLIQDWDRRGYNYQSNAIVTASPSQIAERNQMYKNQESMAKATHLLSFFNRSWWNRIWTLQEICNARHAVVLYGEDSISWESIASAARMWYDIDRVFKYCGFSDAVVVSRFSCSGLAAKEVLASKNGGRTPPLLSVLIATTDFKSSDPRDKLFAIAGMSEAIPGFEISYTKPVAEVFKAFATSYLEYSQDLELLQLAGVNHESGLNPLELPSWIPNFENLNHPALWHYHLFQNTNYKDHITNVFKIWSPSPFETILHTPTPDSGFRPQGTQVATIDEVCAPSVENTPGDPGWLMLAYKRFGVEYHPPTMSCHILQAYFRTLMGDRYEPENISLAQFKNRSALAGAFWEWLRKPFSNLLQTIDVSCGIDQLLLGEKADGTMRIENGDHYFGMVSAFANKLATLHFFVTSDGYMGYGPECQKGDIISILHGCSVPLLLRPRKSGYIILGQAFVLGIMNGELFKGIEDVEKIDGGKIFDIL